MKAVEINGKFTDQFIKVNTFAGSTVQINWEKYDRKEQYVLLTVEEAKRMRKALKKAIKEVEGNEI